MFGLPSIAAWLTPDWAAPPGVHAAVTTRLLPGNSQPPFDAFNLGTRCGEDLGTVAANRALLARSLDLPGAPRWLRQVHGTTVAEFRRDTAADDEPDFDKEPEADAAVTREVGVVLTILTADCLPVLLCARDGSVVAVAHAGWRGLAAGVVEATLQRMAVPGDQMLAWLGPAIGAASYEVGDEVRAAFVDADAGATAAFAPTRPGHWHCDLAALARRRLARAGVGAVAGGDLDTFTDPRFYSYRAAPRTGRFASLVWIAP